MAEIEAKPAFYASSSAGGWRDWWVILHPPYTAWHLAYVVLGACMAPVLSARMLGITVLAFFLAVGIGAHSLDEVHGRPLGTRIPTKVLAIVAGASLTGAAFLGVVAMVSVGPWLVLFIVAGVFLVLAYNLELFDGIFHTDLGFALSWGAFPVITGYFAQTGRVSFAAIAASAAAMAIATAQRALSTPARILRRRTTDVGGHVRFTDGSKLEIDRTILLQPLEAALRALSWGMVALAVALALDRFGWPR